MKDSNSFFLKKQGIKLIQGYSSDYLKDSKQDNKSDLKEDIISKNILIEMTIWRTHKLRILIRITKIISHLKV